MLGVVWRLEPRAQRDGLWRAASTLTYANATAAVLVPLTLTALALLFRKSRSLPLGLVLTVLCTGLAVTLSRAGALALLVGLAVLVLMWIVLRALLPPLAGAAVAFVGLLPSLPVTSQPRPGLAVAGFLAGIGVTTVLLRDATRRWAIAALATFLVVVLLVGHAVGATASFREAGLRVWDKRANVASPTRSEASAAALRVVAEHPVAGVAPGGAVLRWSDSEGRLQVQQYVHNEYLQVLTELGAIGVALLAVLLAGVARLLWRNRPLGPAPALWAGAVAACVATAVHAGFDFVWHVPAVPLTVAVLVGLAVAPVTRMDRAT
jgi:O-antigen ligase